jgi:hypothetical protein
MKKKNPSDSGAQYAGTQPIQHGEIVLSQSESTTKETDDEQVINSEKATDPQKTLFNKENPQVPVTRQDQKPKGHKVKLKPIL